MASLINGISGDFVSIEDRGLAYGDGLFETIAIVNGRAQLLDLHLQRLQQSCLRLAINVDMAALNLDINNILQSAQPEACEVLKIIVTRQSGQRGYGYVAGGANRLLQLSATSVDYKSLQQQGVRLRFCDTQLAINPLLAGMKHLCRLENVLARAEWHDQSIYEGLMLDTQGCVTEGVMSNIFIVKDGMLITPHLDRCGVAGVMREYILSQLAPKLQLAASVDRVLPEHIHNADELFICNSLIGIVPVTTVAAFNKKIGATTRLLQRALHDELYV
ncbi:aminodeoxychorismate lyase [Dasania sp. GY-MA-18]|uniref:Aminodeoxychorismate lyase n=1 Tax=Dasania phycosphaerae TaxID=2950436 RepID=A0A9J6RJ09_9GAMM|nr:MULTISPECIES: aminodeoxychorismate lyase [Dasania]MCR8921942.1 aminodeoxychorismate lyase [Dasania sp. GY-MA-18]MCZ0864370.1 aminodeoxychorismate lyase [Dasania phycosphaerae]MCZ0868098.1 aminodeoxychorismate lyase [Dasania phycosphaerae]